MQSKKIISRFFALDEEENARQIMVNWDKTSSQLPPLEKIEFIQDNFIRENAEKANISAPIIIQIIKQKKLLTKDAETLSFLWHCHQIINEGDNGREMAEAMPELENIPPESKGTFFILLAISGFPKAIVHWKDKGLPQNILLETYKDLNVWVEYYYREFNLIGIKKRALGWMQAHFNATLFKLGRLQFNVPRPFGNYLYILKDKKNNLRYLSAEGKKYNCNGLIDGVDDIWDEDGGWISTLKIDKNQITGNEINRKGYVEKNLTTFRLDDWKIILRPGDLVINIHIPAGEPLATDACRKSLSMANNFFAKYFSTKEHKAFVCYSWLLDSQLKGILKSDSNIIRFQKLGQIFPMSGTSDAIERIFGPHSTKDNIYSQTHQSSIQKTVAKFIDNGGILRNGGLIILRDIC